jgi:hypothetical protein
VLLGTSLRTSWEHDENTLRKHWEQGEKTPSTPPAKGKNLAHQECIQSIPIGCIKLLFQNYLSPFLAWANGKTQNVGEVSY